MKRLFAVIAAMGLVVISTPAPASAAPSELGTCRAVPLSLPLGVEVPVPSVCIRVDGDQAITTVVDGAGEIVSTLVEPINTVVERVEVFVPGPPVPGPTVTLRPPAPATVTRTTTASPEANGTATVTATRTAESTPTPATVTTTATITTGGQPTTGRDTIDGDSLPTLAEPPADQGALDLIPDDPETAAAAGSLFGLFLGIILGIIGLYVAYRRGQVDGEKATLQEFLGIIRGEPATTGRHRLDE